MIIQYIYKCNKAGKHIIIPLMYIFELQCHNLNKSKVMEKFKYQRQNLPFWRMTVVWLNFIYEIKTQIRDSFAEC